MTRKPDPQSPESVLAKVRNQAGPGLTPHNAQVIFILERFLARMARSIHRDRFVLKGGILLYLTGKGPATRPTIDIDLLVRGLLSTRAKDIFDVWNLARTEPDLHLPPIVESLRRLASYRETDLSETTIALTEEFAQSPIQNRIWNQFLNRERITAPSLPEVMVEVRQFMRPIHQALIEGNALDRTWQPQTRTWD